MNTLILHPTAATAVPVTHVKAGVSGKAKTVKKPREMTRDDLAILCTAQGFKVVAAHTKAELRAMHVSGQQVRPAAYDRNNQARKAKRAAKKA